MASDGQIVFEVTADGRRAISDIRDITRSIQQETGQWDRAAQESAQSMEGSFSGMLKKITAGFSAVKIGKALLDLGKDAIKAASDLQEVQNVVDVTFGSGASNIEKWAKNAGTQFGLTETQAKKFASTMGAMLKSSGMAGAEIETVSTDLAGLAADMASFYNLDFEEAFSKIRSGMSGMTMPLKELGIDMSVATLNAFALKQGLTKTFDQMSQSEQTMLRYQYLMQATADAQGDFARTSDGYANGVRMLETNLTTLKTNLGDVLLTVVNPLLAGINELFPADGGSRKKSLLDRVAEINIAKEEKIAEIKAIYTEAMVLADELEKLAGNTDAQTAMRNLAEGANTLSSDSVANWQAILQAFTGVDGLENLFGTSSTETINELADALAGNGISKSKAEAWQTFMSALADNAGAVSSLTGTSASETEAWLRGLAEAAGELSTDDAEAWNTLMTSLLSGVNLNTEEGQGFVDLLAQNFLALGKDSAEAVAGLSALGYSTEEIEEKQAAWLEICKELSHTIPGLSNLINENTGEIKGGIPALREYAEEWERAARYEAEIEAIRAQRQVYEETEGRPVMVGKTVSARAKSRAKLTVAGFDDSEIEAELDAIDAVIKKMVDAGAAWEDIRKVVDVHLAVGETNASETHITQLVANAFKIDPKQFDWVNTLKGDAKTAVLDFIETLYDLYMTDRERPLVLESLTDAEEELAAESGKTTAEIEAEAKAAEEAAHSMTMLEKAASGDSDAISEVTSVVEEAQSALEELSKYVEQVHTRVESSINSTVKGFERIETPMQKNRRTIKDLTAEMGSLDSSAADYQTRLQEITEEIRRQESAQVSARSMARNLQEQAAWMDEYLENLRTARSLGVSDEVLAMLSDGSEESFDYLAALAEATPEEAAEINRQFQSVIEKKREMAQELTGQQLAVDETYQSMAEAAAAAVAALDLETSAKENAGKTIAGLASGIAEHVPDVQTAVDSIIAELDRLSGWGISVSLGGFGNISFTSSTGETTRGDPANGAHRSHKAGLDYVPFDDYLARLHEGEAVLTAEENRVWQGLHNGAVAGVDLDSLGGVMRDNIRPGGNVYLDGKAVGTVISAQQGRAFKSLQRSGWQA